MGELPDRLGSLRGRLLFVPNDKEGATDGHRVTEGDCQGACQPLHLGLRVCGQLTTTCGPLLAASSELKLTAALVAAGLRITSVTRLCPAAFSALINNYAAKLDTIQKWRQWEC